MSRPPGFATTLLRLMSPSHRVAEIEGDFVEVFDRWLATRGAVYARARYWREVVSLGLWRAVGRFRAWQDRRPRRRRPYQTQRGGGGMWRDLRQDLRYGMRTLAKSPGFTAVAVLILALGVGANITMFTVMNTVFFQDPPEIARPAELVGFSRVTETGAGSAFGYPDIAYFRENNDLFAGIAGYDNSDIAVVLGGGDELSQATAWAVTGNFFDVLGVQMALGRGFTPEESTTPLTHPVVVLNYGFWKRYFGADPSVVNRSVLINGSPYMVVGVTPERFRGVSPIETPPDLYTTVMMQGAFVPGYENYLDYIDGNVMYWLRAIGRIQTGVDMETAQANMDVLRSRWELDMASWLEATEPRPWRVVLTSDFSLGPAANASLRQTLTLLTLVVLVVMLIASANIAVLLLARASTRQREIGIRAALGAGRARVVRQLFTESLLLAAFGGVAGLAMSFWTAGVAAGLLPFSFSVELRPDIRVGAFAIGLSSIGAILFGLAPALQLSRSDVMTFLQRGASRSTRTTLRHSLVVGQLALSIVLVTGAGLFARSLRQAHAVDLGFQPSGKLLVSVRLSTHGYDEADGLVLFRSMTDRLEGLPGVQGVTLTRMTPFRGGWGSSVRVPGTEYAEERYDAWFNSVGPNYFGLMRIPVIAGREFTVDDRTGSQPVIVVNEQLSEELWPGENPIGRIVQRGGADWTVIGVARTAQYYNVGEEPQTQAYLPLYQAYTSRMTFMVSTTGDPVALTGSVERAFREENANLPVFNVITLDSVVAQEIARYRVTAILVTVFGGLALLLASVGLYGVQSYLVSQRTREIGLRLALGAVQRQVAGAVLGRGLLLALVGVGIGITAAFGLGKLVEGMLFGVTARDPLTFLSVPILLLGVAVLASLVPARRASRVDPMVALREE